MPALLIQALHYANNEHEADAIVKELQQENFEAVRELCGVYISADKWEQAYEKLPPILEKVNPTLRNRIRLKQYASYIPRDRSGVTTVAGEWFSFDRSCQLAHLICTRFGYDDEATHQGWCRLMESNPSLQEVMALVYHHTLMQGN